MIRVAFPGLDLGVFWGIGCTTKKSLQSNLIFSFVCSSFKSIIFQTEYYLL